MSIQVQEGRDRYNAIKVRCRWLYHLLNDTNNLNWSVFAFRAKQVHKGRDTMVNPEEPQTAKGGWARQGDKWQRRSETRGAGSFFHHCYYLSISSSPCGLAATRPWLSKSTWQTDKQLTFKKALRSLSNDLLSAPNNEHFVFVAERFRKMTLKCRQL